PAIQPPGESARPSAPPGSAATAGRNHGRSPSPARTSAPSDPPVTSPSQTSSPSSDDHEAHIHRRSPSVASATSSALPRGSSPDSGRFDMPRAYGTPGQAGLLTAGDPFRILGPVSIRPAGRAVSLPSDRALSRGGFPLLRLAAVLHSRTVHALAAVTIAAGAAGCSKKEAEGGERAGT